MNGLPYYKAYPRDFIEGTIGLPFEIKCAYRVVLDMIYMQGGNLPDDPRYISGLLGCSIRKWRSIRSTLLELGKIEVSGEFLTNKRAEKELETLSKLQEKQSEKASNPRKSKDLTQPQLSQPEPEPEPEPDIKEDTNVSSKKTRRKPLIELPSGWVPNEKNIADALKKGLTEKEIDHEADQFRNHHHSKQSKFRDWNAAWRTWVNNYIKFSENRRVAIQSGSGGYGQGGSIASIVARRRAEGKV